jgi:hypothetical protein
VLTAIQLDIGETAVLYEWGLGDRISCTDAEKKDCEGLIEDLIALAVKVHEQGLLSLEDDIKEMPTGYLRTLLQLGVHGNSPEVIRDIMEKRLLVAGLQGVALLRRLIELEFIIEIVRASDTATIRIKLYGLLDMDPDEVRVS